MFTNLAIWIKTRQSQPDAEAGLQTIEVLSWAAISVLVIVVLGAALQALGVDVIDRIRTQIGV
jgi:hypothetical protein